MRKEAYKNQMKYFTFHNNKNNGTEQNYFQRQLIVYI